MALSRSVSLYSPLHRSSHLIPFKHNFIFPNYPRKPSKFAHQPLCLSSSSSMDAPPEGYRRNVGICLINSSKKIFAASRLDIPNSWQMPQLFQTMCITLSSKKFLNGIDLYNFQLLNLNKKFDNVHYAAIETFLMASSCTKANFVNMGGIDEGEDPKVAAIRELREETGIGSVEVLAEVPYWLTYDFPPKVREKLKIKWGGDWKGQAQKWFLFKFTGKDEEINLQGDGTEEPEFGEWSWLPPDQIIDHAVDFKQPVYKEVLTVFAPYLQ